MKKKWVLIIVLAAGLLLGACSPAVEPQSNQADGMEEPLQARFGKDQVDDEIEQKSQAGPDTEVHADVISSLSSGEAGSAELEGVLFMREEEKLARDVYLQLGELWAMNIFGNIAASENTHMEAVLGLIGLFGLADPVGDNPPGVFKNQELQDLYNELVGRGSQSLSEAMLVGGAVEEIDILDLQQYLSRTEDEAIREVYQNLLQGSINHLASFARTYERQTGKSYQPQLLSQEDFKELIAQAAAAGNGGISRGMNGSPQGRGGGRQ